MDKQVSVIMPVYNAEAFVAESIESVLAQSYVNWELIVVNDASTDGSAARIAAYAAKDERIVFLSLRQNAGVANARNRAIEQAKGHYLAFLDSDDLWFPDKLRIQVQFMEQHQAVLSHCAYQKVDEGGTVIAKKIGVGTSVDYQGLLKHNEIGLLTAMYSAARLGKRYFKSIGHEDYAYWLQILKEGHVSRGINDILASYRVHGSSLSHNKLRSAGYTWRIYRDEEKLPLFTRTFYFFCYAVLAGLKFIKR